MPKKKKKLKDLDKKDGGDMLDAFKEVSVCLNDQSVLKQPPLDEITMVVVL